MTTARKPIVGASDTDAQAIGDHKARPAGKQELDVLAYITRSARIEHEIAIGEMTRLYQYEIPDSLTSSQRSELKTMLDASFTGWADAANISADQREVAVFRAAGKSQATNDALAVGQTRLDRRESAQLRKAAK